MAFEVLIGLAVFVLIACAIVFLIGLAVSLDSIGRLHEGDARDKAPASAGVSDQPEDGAA